MIFDIKENANGDVVFVEVIEGTAWDAVWMFKGEVFLGCWDGYENCLIFPKD